MESDKKKGLMLTDAQIAKLEEYRDRFIGYGISCKPADRAKAEECIDRIYQNALPNPLPPPKKKIWVDSPLAGAKMAFKLLKEAGESPTIDSILECGFGQHDTSWLASYSFFAIECKLAEAEPILPLAELCQEAGWWWPFDEVCILSDTPCEMHRNDLHQLHCENGPALLYRDGFALYVLNGVLVPEEYVMTPAHKLDPELVIKEPNVEVRRELLRKITIERFIQKFHPKVLSKQGDYELLEISGIRDFPKMIYLKMINPSIKTFHLEGVDPSIQTVQEAINWRAGNMVKKDEDWDPSVLT